MNSASTYYRSYSRALFSYVNNGFFARDLDADDFAFIERVRERGCVACGSLAWPAPTACTHSDDVIPRVALIEEMDFWQQPYQVDLQVTRRSGPVAPLPPRPVGMTPQAIKRKQARELKLAALAEERRRLEEKQREQIRRDIAWERAAPKTAPFGKIKKRHFIPQWKINNDQWAASEAAIDDEFMPRKLTAVEQAERDRNYKDRVAARKQAREMANRDGCLLTVQELDTAASRLLAGKQPDFVLEKRRLDALHEAAAKDELKRRILQVMHNSFPQAPSLDAIMTATECTDKDFMIRCADELVSEGRLCKRDAA